MTTDYRKQDINDPQSVPEDQEQESEGLAQDATSAPDAERESAGESLEDQLTDDLGAAAAGDDNDDDDDGEADDDDVVEDDDDQEPVSTDPVTTGGDRDGTS